MTLGGSLILFKYPVRRWAEVFRKDWLQRVYRQRVLEYHQGERISHLASRISPSRKWAKGCMIAVIVSHCDWYCCCSPSQLPSRQRKRPICHPGRMTVVLGTGCVDWDELFRERDRRWTDAPGINRPPPKGKKKLGRLPDRNGGNAEILFSPVKSLP